MAMVTRTVMESLAGCLSGARAFACGSVESASGGGGDGGGKESLAAQYL